MHHLLDYHLGELLFLSICSGYIPSFTFSINMGQELCLYDYNFQDSHYLTLGTFSHVPVRTCEGNGMLVCLGKCAYHPQKDTVRSLRSTL